MNGPDHYREAENDLEYADNRPMGEEADFFLARAQVHATLAQTAALIELRAVYVYKTDRVGIQHRHRLGWNEVVD